MAMKNTICSTLAVLIIVFIGSCSKQESYLDTNKLDQEHTLKNDNKSDLKEYKSIIRTMGFNVDSCQDIGDHIVVEGHIRFSKDKLDSYQPPENKHAITNITLSRSAVSTIKVFVQNSIPFGGPDDWRYQLEQAMSHWNNLPNSVIHLSTTTLVQNAHIIVASDGGILSNQTIASSEFPVSNSAPGSSIIINLDALDNIAFSSAQKIYILAHEIGHCIGYRHTNWLVNNESAAIEIGHTIPSVDPNSVMNSGSESPSVPSWNGFSVYDQLAADFIYPQWAFYSQLGGVHWYGTNAMTTLGSQVYAVNNAALYRINHLNGSYTQIGNAVWSGTNAMTGLNGHIYIVQNSRLYKVNSNTGTYIQLGNAVWASTNAMTSSATDIYLVQNSRFYKVNPNTGDYTQLGGAVWENTEAMCFYNNDVYLVQNNRLYRVNTNTGGYEQLGSAVWGGTAAMTVNGNSIYIIQNDIYHKVSPVNGTWQRLGGIVWAGTEGMASIGYYNYIIENGRFYQANIN